MRLTIHHVGSPAQDRLGGQSPLLQYQPSGGATRDRQEAALAMRARGMATGEDDVIVTAGGQNALHAILGTVLAPGDVVCAGRSTYPGMLALAKIRLWETGLGELVWFIVAGGVVYSLIEVYRAWRAY